MVGLFLIILLVYLLLLFFFSDGFIFCVIVCISFCLNIVLFWLFCCVIIGVFNLFRWLMFCVVMFIRCCFLLIWMIIICFLVFVERFVMIFKCWLLLGVILNWCIIYVSEKMMLIISKSDRKIDSIEVGLVILVVVFVVGERRIVSGVKKYFIDFNRFLFEFFNFFDLINNIC